EMGPAASSNWKSGKISTPIMEIPPCPEMREICHFRRKAIMRWSPRQAKSGGIDVGSPSNRNCAVPARHPARLHRPLAGVFQRARRENSSDLEAHRAGAE